MIAAARDGAGPECMMACLPCMVSYGWIFTRLLERFRRGGHALLAPGPGLRARSAVGGLRDGRLLQKKIGTGLEPAQGRRCAEIFGPAPSMTPLLEMSAAPGEDI